jgi:non-ribosomal peptide synthetase component E (peptide arylation enzyme)
MVAYLRGQDLASFKLPERLEIRESLPHLSEVNKVDKRSLRQEIAQMLEDEAHSRPRSRGSSRK